MTTAWLDSRLQTHPQTVINCENVGDAPLCVFFLQPQI